LHSIIHCWYDWVIVCYSFVVDVVLIVALCWPGDVVNSLFVVILYLFCCCSEYLRRHSRIWFPTLLHNIVTLLTFLLLLLPICSILLYWVHCCYDYIVLFVIPFPLLWHCSTLLYLLICWCDVVICLLLIILYCYIVVSICC